MGVSLLSITQKKEKPKRGEFYLCLYNQYLQNQNWWYCTYVQHSPCCVHTACGQQMPPLSLRHNCILHMCILSLEDSWRLLRPLIFWVVEVNISFAPWLDHSLHPFCYLQDYCCCCCLSVWVWCWEGGWCLDLVDLPWSSEFHGWPGNTKAELEFSYQIFTFIYTAPFKKY